MSLGLRIFIGFVFTTIGLSFLATTAVLFHEFEQVSWLALATFYSHLFIFFPTFGIVALLGSTLPRARIVTIAGAGHMLPVTHREIVNREIVAHILGAGGAVELQAA